MSAERLLLVMRLDGGAAQSVFVEVPGEIAEKVLAEVSRVLNERLSGLTLGEIRRDLAERLRDTRHRTRGQRAAEHLPAGRRTDFRRASAVERVAGAPGTGIAAGRAARIREWRQSQEVARAHGPTRGTGPAASHRTRALRASRSRLGTSTSIQAFRDFTVVTAEYHSGSLSGVIGVIGPTRMPYEKIVTLVTHTSNLISDLLD